MFAPCDLREARATLKRLGVGTLLSKPSANPKLEKSIGYGMLTAPLHLAPAKLSGYEVCPKATAGCRAACLHTSGNPVYMRGKAKARNARTRAYFEAREAFLLCLVDEVARHERAAIKRGMGCGVRLNATSDIPFERVPVQHHGVTFSNIMEAFPDVQFYDYTKRSNRRNLPPNYHLTFSLAENNDREAETAIRNGLSVAVVFNVKRNWQLPASYRIGSYSLRVIDGDLHDYRPSDPRGVIVGLRAKGKAIADTSGFVRATPSI